MPYEIAFAESVQAHFGILTARERATVLGTIDRQLLHEPLKETRHRKPPCGPTQSRRGSYASASSGYFTRWSARRVEPSESSQSGGRYVTH